MENNRCDGKSPKGFAEVFAAGCGFGDLLNHLNLFGDSYLGAVLRVVQIYL